MSSAQDLPGLSAAVHSRGDAGREHRCRRKRGAGRAAVVVDFRRRDRRRPRERPSPRAVELALRAGRLIEAIGARAQWRDAAPGGVAFADMASGERWTLRPGGGPLPWWILRSAPTRAANAPEGLLARGSARPRPRERAARRLRAERRSRRRTALAPVRARRAQHRSGARLGAARRRALGETRLGGARPLTPVRGFERGVCRARGESVTPTRRRDPFRAPSGGARSRERGRGGARIRTRPR